MSESYDKAAYENRVSLSSQNHKTLAAFWGAVLSSLSLSVKEKRKIKTFYNPDTCNCCWQLLPLAS
jgi:hypothetical protein